MNTNAMWQDHVTGLTRQVSYLLQKVQELEERSTYYENVVITLITALKKGGIIVEDPAGDNEMPP